ncbi:hypothetical protein DFH28DRAFT_504844 [Melampsora americana]|nr:hypothetical protein DFH28DRAFT_504844 [Melampsora americana]
MCAKISRFSPPFFIHMNLITLLSFSLAGMHFYDQMGFVDASPAFPDGQKMVNTFSFKSHNDNERSLATTVRQMATSNTRQDSLELSVPSMNIPYSSYYKSAWIFHENQSHKGDQIKELASKVLKLASTLDHKPILQYLWLQENLVLVEECQSLAKNALLEPKKLNNLERLWASGIWLALETGKKPNMSSGLKIPQKLNKQVYMEIQATFYYPTTITQAFDKWVGQRNFNWKEVQGTEVEESLKRAALIGKHEDRCIVNPLSVLHPIEKVISGYLIAWELPQDTQRASDILAQFRDIFKNIQVQSWEGQYVLEIFQHILSFPSSHTIIQSLDQAIQDEEIWRDLHIPLAKNDIIQLSEKMKPFLTKHKISSKGKLNLYSILRDPLQEHEHFNDAIKKLLRILKTMPKEQLKNAYQLIMAHDLLRPSVENELMSTPSWDIVEGLQKAWTVLYPGFKLNNLEVMDYRYYILIKYPQLLAHVRWDAFIHDAQKVSKSLSQASKRKSLWERPQIAYDVSNYTEEYYHKIITVMKGGNEWVLYPMGLELLMQLYYYLPKGPEYLIKMLKKDEFVAWVDIAIDYVKSTGNWRHEGKLPCSESQSAQLRYFVATLQQIIRLQVQVNDDIALVAEWSKMCPPRTEACLVSGVNHFGFNPSSWERAWKPLGYEVKKFEGGKDSRSLLEG